MRKVLIWNASLHRSTLTRRNIIIHPSFSVLNISGILHNLFSDSKPYQQLDEWEGSRDEHDEPEQLENKTENSPYILATKYYLHHEIKGIRVEFAEFVSFIFFFYNILSPFPFTFCLHIQLVLSCHFNFSLLTCQNFYDFNLKHLFCAWKGKCMRLIHMGTDTCFAEVYLFLLLPTLPNTVLKNFLVNNIRLFNELSHLMKYQVSRRTFWFSFNRSALTTWKTAYEIHRVHRCMK